MTDAPDHGFDTMLIHAGTSPDPATGAGDSKAGNTGACWTRVAVTFTRSSSKTTRPSTMSNPCGLFIQPLTAITLKVPAKPETTTVPARPW